MAPYNGDKGVNSARDVMGYKPPTGPRYQDRCGPGLRGGTNFGNAGSQGKKSLTAEASGSETDLNTDSTLLGGSQRG